MAVEATGVERTAARSAAGAGSERARRLQGRVQAAVEASYLAQLSRDLRLTIAQPARTAEPCAGHGA
jgi:hypothetical protein